MNTQSDATLLKLFAGKENPFESEEAFRQLVRRHGGMVQGVCERTLGCRADAEEAAQATFVALALKAHRVTPENLGGWLHHVARQIARDLLRARVRREARHMEAARRREAFSAVSPGDDDLDDAIAALPEKLRAAVVGHYLEGVSQEELASRFGCSVSAVSMRLSRARDRLRERLGVVLAGLAVVTPTAEAVLMRSVSIARAGAEAASPGSLLALAKEALWRMTVARLKWLGMAGGAAASVAMLWFPAAVALEPTRPAGAAGAASKSPAALALSASEAVAAEIPSLAGWEEQLRARLRPVVKPEAGEHPLLAALKGKVSPWESGPAFKRLVESSGNLNAIRDAEGRTPLHWAVIRRWDDCALLLMLRGADVNAADASGMTPLFYAIGAGDDETQQLLLLRGADVNHRAGDGSTPLTAAALQGGAKPVDLLLWAGANPVVAGEPEERQPLTIARRLGVEETVRLLEESVAGGGGPRLDAEPRRIPTFVKNALHEAAKVADFEKLDAFLRSGAPIDLPDGNGRTALMQAIGAAQHDVIFYLLMLKANPNAVDHKGATALMATMGWLGHSFDVDRRNLLAREANPLATRKDGFSELTWALERDNEHGAMVLLMLGADGHKPTPRGTPFQIAFQAGRARMMDILRRFGIDEPVQWSDDPVWNLHNAVRRGDAADVEQWLATGVDINTPDKEGHSPLIMAIATRNESIAKLLIKRGADINFENPKNRATPMYMTMVWDYPGMTEFRRALFEAGAAIDIPMGKKGETPLMRGVWHQPTMPLRQLLEFGADINARNADGLTPLGIALKKGYRETAEFLREQGGHE